MEISRKRILTLGALLATVAVLLIALGVSLYAVVQQGASRSAASAVDMRGNRVQLDPGVAPVAASTSRAVTNTGGHLIIDAVGLDVPLGALNSVDGQITPPGFTSAYWVRDMGVAVSKATVGTVFVVMHSLRNGGVGPGNYLTDIPHQRSKVPVGAIVSVDGIRYAVTGSQLILKSTIASRADVWSNTPNRLVLITCLEHADGSPSTDNLLVTATRVP